MTANTHYDFVSAAQRLEQLVAERSTENLAGRQLTNWDVDQSAHALNIIENGHTSAKRMSVSAQAISDPHESMSAENIEYTEAVWHIQGVLSSVELPPFVVRGKLKDKVKFLRQGIRLSGLNTASFELAVQKIQDIMAIWCRSVSKILPATFLGEDEQGNYLDLSNRYFSSTRDGRGGPAKRFTDEVDPTGVLSIHGNDQYYHGEENTVLYLQRCSSAQAGRKRLTPVPPVTFKKGDIVEVQVTFMLIPAKLNAWRMVPTLRCITLLDGQFAQACVRESLHFRNATTSGCRTSRSVINRTLKRRYGPDLDEDEGETVLYTKVARMEVDDGCKG
ncbi:hypothetical protein NMY22_g16038 [Coprinellus aureogranulatus]|nr:hypothetical protein NMY22_g16038 [Coprinellus aureogranulatus]